MNITIIVLICFISLFLFINACRLTKKIFDEDNNANNIHISISVLYSTDNIKLKLGDIANRMRWIDEDIINKIILIDGGLNLEQKEICRNYCDKYDYFIFTSPDNLSNLVFELQKNT